jgi:PIN domain nuclease of toxin-antitoxin system
MPTRADAKRRGKPARARIGPGALILDTHVWLWAVEGNVARLNAPVRAAIERAAAAGQLLASAISVWELAMLVRKGRLTLATPLEQWIRASQQAPGLQLVAVGPEIALDSVTLPDFDAHKDPADRIIIATARRYGVLVTSDDAILGWAGRSRHVRVLDARP